MLFKAKGEHNGLMPLKTVCPNLGRFGEAFFGNGSRAGVFVDKSRMCAGPSLL